MNREHDSPPPQRLFQGRKFGVERARIPDAAGEVFVREWVVHPGAVAIVPMLDPETVVLIRNQRPAIGRALWEVPAGTLEPPEPAETCAHRELVEEIGYRAERMEPLGTFYTTPGFCTERLSGFLAEGLEHVGQALEPGESITVEPVAWAEAMAMIETGRIEDGKTIALLLFCDRFRRGSEH